MAGEKRKGILYILLAALFFSLMTAFVRLSGDLPTMQKTLFRNLVAAAASWIMLLSGKEKIMLETYVQITYFDRILSRANVRLMVMSRPPISQEPGVSPTRSGVAAKLVQATTRGPPVIT